VNYLSKIDYGIVLVYFALLIALGLYLRRLASQNMESYFLAGKRLPWWMLGFSGMGYSLDLAGTMLIISLLYIIGPRGLFIEFRGGVSLALVCQMIWTGKWHRRSGCMTVAEWMSYRFGEGRMADFARISTAFAFIIFTTAMLTYMVVGIGLFMALFIPLAPWQCSLILIAIGTFYTALSGLYGVVVSDMFQSGLIIFGIIVVVVLTVGHVGDGAAFAALADKVTGADGWVSSVPALHTRMPKGYEQYENLMVYALFFLVLNKLIIGGFGTGHEPHFFAARNERDCGKLSCLWAVLMTCRWPMMICYAVLGILLVHNFVPDQSVLADAAVLIKQHVSVDPAQWREVLAQIKLHPDTYSAALIDGLRSTLGENWSQKIDLVSYGGTVNPEVILPSVLLYRVPSGFRGLILVSLIAASMSTFDVTMNKSAAMFTNDVYRRYLRPLAANRELLTATYAFCVAVVIASFILAYNIPNINDIWGWITMGLWSGIGMPLLLRFYWWRFNATGYAAGMFAGPVAALAVLLFNIFNGQSGEAAPLSEVGQFLLLTPISLVFAVAGTYLAPPTPAPVLEHFYRTTRPFGWWKPLRGLLPAAEHRAMQIEHRNDLLALPFAFIWMVAMYLLPMQLIIKQHAAAAVTALLFVVSLVGMYRYWYRNLPPVAPSAEGACEAVRTQHETPTLRPEPDYHAAARP